MTHWHHWSDVLVGQLVGLLLAVAAFQMRHWLSHTNVETCEKLKKISAQD